MTYCSLADARAELKSVSSVDDDKLFRYVMMACRRIDSIMAPARRRPYFDPYIEQRAFRIDGRHVSSYDNALYFRDPLLEITAVLADTTDVTASVEAWPPTTTPIGSIHFKFYSRSWYDYGNGDYPPYAKVTGPWGFHADYTNAWAQVDSLAAALTAAATSLTVADVDGDDPWGFSPRISRGHLLKIGTEYFEVTTTDTTANTAAVRRGANGSTAAAHDNGSAVYVWYPEWPVRRVAARQAGMMYARQGAFQVETVDGVGSISYPQDLLAELRMTLNDYLYWGQA